ncbi:uncharacterized protein PFL1_00901 [Pseudozyma flocculosa PF-1]|uniref:Uncharacterized protein n=1 Tax=Pseudozyma flocculosa TaxID=84751 RepID=A0A5C3F601_9BASI|nr:uncharacterized protein PFL1_00901 [Pseudozyma flocculosa PF-1]EPQ31568.1 hypothetical protein PFL1_00901 [Pseudozyma flocculosa PF-1]SPO38641.1 uncharacterized protein PSFLO_04120 [Pseudozyma flocculosa]
MQPIDTTQLAPLLSQLRRYTRQHASSPPDEQVDLCLVSRDGGLHLVDSALFSHAVRTELLATAAPGPEPGVRIATVTDSSDEIETVLLARSNDVSSQEEVYDRISRLDARDTVFLMERFARYECWGFEVRIWAQLRDRLEGRDRHLLDDAKWLSGVYAQAEALERWEVCEFLWPHCRCCAMFGGGGGEEGGFDREVDVKRRRLC